MAKSRILPRAGKLFILLVMVLAGAPSLVNLSNCVFANSVDTAWVRRYNGPENGVDGANAIAVFDSSNVYVTGYISGIAGSRDYATIKYNPNGDTLWVRTYNGPGNGSDSPRDIAVGRSPDFFCVTGRSEAGETADDYATLRYYSSGDELWLRRYDGTADFGDDMAYAIATDDIGNVYVTGASQRFGADYDYATIKYNSDGSVAWERRYDGDAHGDDKAYAILVDSDGCVFVTGESMGMGTGFDFVTIKYNPDGDSIWGERYNGTGNGNDGAKAIAQDNHGYIYVTGYSDGSPDETVNHDYVTIKYEPFLGTKLWERRYNGTGDGTDEPLAIAVHGDNYVYVTGRSYGSGTSYDIATIQYDYLANATVKRYDGPEKDWDEGHAIAVDGSGSVYVTGLSMNPNYNFDYVTLKYDFNTEDDWMIRYDGPDGLDDAATDMAVDASGNVYVTGVSWSAASFSDFATIKYVQFKSGDVNCDKTINLSDAIYLTNYLFRMGLEPTPFYSGDVNDDDMVNLSDVIYILNYLFKDGPPPSP
jgi:uncharacterized delta-60 repeat protein